MIRSLTTIENVKRRQADLVDRPWQLMKLLLNESKSSDRKWRVCHESTSELSNDTRLCDVSNEEICLYLLVNTLPVSQLLSKLTDGDVDDLDRLLEFVSGELSFEEVSINPPDIILNLVEALKYNRTITSLNLNSCERGCDSGSSTVVEALHEMLTLNQTIVNLTLCANRFESNCAVTLADILLETNSLTTVLLASNSFKSADICLLADASTVNHSVTNVSLSWLNKGDESALIEQCSEALAFVLKVNQTLTRLEISRGLLTALSCVAFAEGLKATKLLLSSIFTVMMLGPLAFLLWHHLWLSITPLPA